MICLAVALFLCLGKAWGLRSARIARQKARRAPGAVEERSSTVEKQEAAVRLAAEARRPRTPVEEVARVRRHREARDRAVRPNGRY